jgi:hypothetical protein
MDDRPQPPPLLMQPYRYRHHDTSKDYWYGNRQNYRTSNATAILCTITSAVIDKITAPVMSSEDFE